MEVTELERLRDAATAVAGRFQEASLVVVFGSVAARSARPWSDVDVGVAGVDLWRGAELGHALGSLFGREPHVVDLDAASDRLRFEVARGGVLLRESEPGAWARFQAESAVRWFDLAPIVALCRKGVEQRLMRDAVA